MIQASSGTLVGFRSTGVPVRLARPWTTESEISDDNGGDELEDDRARGRIDFSGVTARYGHVVALDDVSLTVEAGEHLAITGSNGSGKSTLLRCLLGLHPAERGVVRVDGEAARRRAEWRARRRLVAYVPQRPATGAFPLLVRELLDSVGAPAAAHDAARALGVDHLLDRPLHTLSGGQLQRSVIARGLACTQRGAVALVADEPTSALDFDGQDEVADLLTSVEATVVIVSHEPALVARCDRVVEMAGGRIRERRS